MENSFTAWYFDGKTASRRAVDIEIFGRSFCLYEQEERHGPFEADNLYFIGESGSGPETSLTYGLKDIDGWRLGMKGTIPAALLPLLPARRRYGGWIDRIGLARASIAFAAVSAIVLTIILLTPQWLAPIIPPSVEQNLGKALVGDFGGRFCKTAEGQAALQKLVRSIDGGPGQKGRSDLRVEVAKIDIVNAVALPGNNVILFDGLVRAAKSPDEVAGVLAHEIGHVRRRHVMQALLRQLGLSIILGGANSDGASMLGGALSMGYSRSAESEADQHSINALAKANISPVATAGFFERLSKMEENAVKDKKIRNLTGYMSSHPLSSGRKRAFEDSLTKGRKYQPALTHAEWQELKTMCARDRKAESGLGFEF